MKSVDQSILNMVTQLGIEGKAMRDNYEKPTNIIPSETYWNLESESVKPDTSNEFKEADKMDLCDACKNKLLSQLMKACRGGNE